MDFGLYNLARQRFVSFMTSKSLPADFSAEKLFTINIIICEKPCQRLVLNFHRTHERE